MDSPLSDPRPGLLSIDIWSDVMCPFCCLGDRHLELALEQFEHREAVRIVYHSFLLAPEFPEGTSMPMTEMLSRQKGMTHEQVEQMNRPVIERGREVGIDFAMDRVVSSSTRKAHELAHFAQARGKGRQMMQRLFRAYFTEGRVLDDAAVLAELAEEVGLDRAEAEEALRERTWRQAVQDDVAVAGQLGVQGVPFFVLGGKYAVSGAQPPEVLLEALRTTWSEREDGAATPAAE